MKTRERDTTRLRAALLAFMLLLASWFPNNGPASATPYDRTSCPMTPQTITTGDTKNLRDIYYAGGCFWGVEEYFSRIPGVHDVSVGYANGKTERPTYEDVCRRDTGHAETVHVRYDPDAVSLKTLTERFFAIIDPVSVNRQGNDAGVQYRTGIYYVRNEDKNALEAVLREEAKKHSRPLAVELQPLSHYYLAEEYHQRYLKKNPGGYCHIDFSSLDDILESPPDQSGPARYAKPADEELRKKLSPEEYRITQQAGTEAPFSGKYWDHKERGIYVDVGTGEPLFVSTDKLDTGCGWSSFTKPIEPEAVVENTDRSHGMIRTEVRSRGGDSHLGHVFPDGPEDKGGLRYCINSAALRFVPYDDMDKEGFGKFKPLVK